LRHFLKSAWARYAIALAAFLLSFFLREALAPWLSSDRGIIVFLPAILFVTFYAGLGPAALTTVLSGIALWYVFLPPYYSFAFNLDTGVWLATFAFGSIAGVTLVHLLQVATSRAKAAQERSAQLTVTVTADLAGMTQLNKLSSLLVREGKDLKACLNHALETAIAIASADKGNVQLFDGNSVALTIAAHRGFEDNFLKFFEEVRNDGTACAEAMRSARRVIVEDVSRSEIFATAPLSLKALADAGVRAVISTPLTSGDGGLLGMISVHSRSRTDRQSGNWVSWTSWHDGQPTTSNANAPRKSSNIWFAKSSIESTTCWRSFRQLRIAASPTNIPWLMQKRRSRRGFRRWRAPTGN